MESKPEAAQEEVKGEEVQQQVVSNDVSSGDQIDTTTYFNEEVQNYEPTIKEEFLTLKTGQYQRLIFETIELREREEEELDKFRDFCKENNITIPEGYDDDKKFVLRVLQGKKWKHDVTAGEILSHSEWKNKTYPLLFDPVKDMLCEGVIYGHKRDKQFRPVIIVDCMKILANAEKIDNLVAATNYFLDHVISKAMIPGKIESWTTIFDLKGIGASQMSNKNIQQVVKAMQKNYPGRLFRFFGIEVGMLFRGVWALAHQFVDDFTKMKMSIYGKDYPEQMLALIPAENLQAKYGGKSPNVEKFWPPQFI